jgi:hypothetical protein
MQSLIICGVIPPLLHGSSWCYAELNKQRNNFMLCEEYLAFIMEYDLVYEDLEGLKRTIFWNITPCGPLSVNRRFGETYRLHLQGRKK